MNPQDLKPNRTLFKPTYFEMKEGLFSTKFGFIVAGVQFVLDKNHSYNAGSNLLYFFEISGVEISIEIDFFFVNEKVTLAGFVIDD